MINNSAYTINSNTSIPYNLTVNGIINCTNSSTSTFTGPLTTSNNLSVNGNATISSATISNNLTVGVNATTVTFTVNADVLTTASWYVSILNNVNGGSVITAIIAPYPSTINASINTSTNVLTLNISYSGGKLMIHRLFKY